MDRPVDVAKLAQIANQVRQDIIEMLVAAGSGHSAGPLGMADVFTALYGAVLNVDPKNPKKADRDRVVLSNAHICPVLYAALANFGFFPREELKTLRKFGSHLAGHSNNHGTPGVETSGGPLGQGLSQAIGMALAAQLDSARWRTYCLMSDGEHDEGQVWEAYMFAAKYKLYNLTVLIDRNNIQIDGRTEDIMPLELFRAKFESFNWHVVEVDGHNIQAIIDACGEAESVTEKPTVIICHTIPGKGVDFMENKFEWHGKPPTAEEAKVALAELRSLGGRIVGEHQ
jgi:transketolase